MGKHAAVTFSGIGVCALGCFFFAAFGPVAGASAAVIAAFEASVAGSTAAFLASSGIGITALGTAGILFTFLVGPGRSTVQSTSAIAEGVMLETICGDTTQSLQKREDHFLEWYKAGTPQWNDSVNLEELKGLTSKERNEMVTFASEFVSPLSGIRTFLLKERRFTIAVMGEPGAGKTAFVSNAYKAAYEERTVEQKTHVVAIETRSGHVTPVHILDFPGMNGNDDFAGANVENLTALLPAIDCILFFSKLNSRCFLANKLLEKVQGHCKVRFVLTHSDTMLTNKYASIVDKQMEEHHLDEEDVDEEGVLKKSLECLIQDKEIFRSRHKVRENEICFWVPPRMLGERYLAKFFADALKPHLQSTRDMKEWIRSLAY